MANNYSYYNSQSQQHHSRHYESAQQPSYSGVTPSSAQQSIPATGGVQWPSRYQYQSPNTYTGGNANTTWYGGNNTAVNSGNRDEGSSRSDAQHQYSYRSDYDSSALGSLAYASSLNTTNAGRSSGSNQQNQQLYAQQSHLQQQPQQTHYGQEMDPSNMYGQQQQQQQPQRPESVNSVGSARSNTYGQQAQRLQSNTPINATYQASQAQTQGAKSATTPTTIHRWNPANYRPQEREQQPTDHSDTNLTRLGMNQVFTRYDHTSRPSNENITLMNQNPNQTAVEPMAQTTVDPTQVYDPYLDYQRQAAKRAAEEEVANKAEAERQAAREADEKRKSEEAGKTAKKQAADKSTQSNTTKQAKANGAKSGSNKKADKSESEKSSTPKRKRKSKAAERNDEDQATAAARTLMQTAMSAGGDLESQMREMFKKMREFNEKNPTLLSKLWQEERDDYLAKAGSQSSPPAIANGSKGATTEKSVKNSTPKELSSPKSTRKQPKETVSAAQIAQENQQKQNIPNTSSVRAPTSGSGAAQKPMEYANNASNSLTRPLPTTPTAPSISTSPASSSGTTVWPADKKITLANAAANLLRGYPANRGKTITASQIAALLDTNPSYLELCKKIESLGFQLDRSTFAKALLAAVPDVTKSQKQSAASQAAQSKQPNENASSLVSEEQKLQEAQAKLMDSTNILDTENKKDKSAKSRSSQSRKIDGEGIIEVETPKVPNLAIDPQLEGLDAIKRFVEGPNQTTITQTPTPRSGNRQKQPSKARTSQAPQAHTTLLKEDQARKRTFADLVDLTTLSDNEESEEPLPKRLETGFDTSNSHLPTPPDTTFGDTRPAINKDLGQLGDPSRPYVPSQSKGNIEHPRQAPIPLDHPIRSVPVAQPLDKYKAIRRSTYDSRTIARDVLLACGRHPDMRHLNAHYNTIRNAFPHLDNFVDLDTLRWDLIDPGGPPVGSGSQAQQSRVEQAMLLDDEDDDEADDEDDENTRHLPDRPAAILQVVGAGGNNTSMEHDFSSRMDTYKMDQKKIKRSLRRSDPGLRQHADSDSTSKRGRGRPRASEGGKSSEHDSAGGSSYSALRAQQLANQGTAPRRGRPVGWRKWMQKGGGGTPAKSSSSKLKPPSPEPHYQVYKCEWEGCSAELHNLKKLRRHVFKLHGKANPEDAKFWCLWQDCGEVQSFHDKATMRTKSRWLHLSFANDAEWKSHVEKKHIVPIAWRLGDGPADGLSDAQDSDAMSEAYMSDQQGRRVTPQVTISEDQEDEARSIIPGKKIPKKSQEDHALDVQKRVEKEKQAIGVGVDKGGARLANEKRRMGFIDDEDVAEVISDED